MNAKKAKPSKVKKTKKVNTKSQNESQKRKSLADDWLTDDGLLRIEGWARDGLTLKQIASNMGISDRTIDRWQAKYPPIAQAIKKGKAPVDIQVENAMLRSALGYTTVIKKAIKLKETRFEDGVKIEKEHVEYVDEEIYVAPNPTIQIFWSKNRMPDKWRDKREPAKESNDAIERLDAILGGLKQNADNAKPKAE